MRGEGSRSISLDLYTYRHTHYGEDTEARGCLAAVWRRQK